MRGMMRLALLGVPGAQGGVSYPTSITDDFSADSGLWLDGDLQPAAITVSGGRAIWTPTKGDNALTNPGFDDATGWTLGTNWEIAGGVATKTAGGVSSAIEQAGVITPKIYYELGFVNVSLTGPFSYVLGGGDPGPRIPAVTFSGNTTTTYKFQPYDAVSGSIDNVWAYPLTTATLFRVQQIYYPSVVEAVVRRPAGIMSGVVLFKDSSNCVMASYNGLRLDIFIRFGGSNIWGAGWQITYGTPYKITLTPTAAFDSFTALYNDATPGVTKAYAGFDDMVGPWYAGMFCTYNSGDLDTSSFASFRAEAVDGANPFLVGEPLGSVDDLGVLIESANLGTMVAFDDGL